MPKEQGHSGEFTSCSSSKNAKEKSNSATLRASLAGSHRNLSGMGDMSKHMLCFDSEKDSGYSEAGSDDQHSNDKEPKRASSQTTSSSTSHDNLTPIYIFKNLQSGADQLLHGPLSWAGGWQSLAGGKAAAQLVLIQQPVVPAPSTSSPTSCSSLTPRQAHVKRGGNRTNLPNNNKNSYLPILNSYPRIAPHPGKETPEGKGAVPATGLKENGSEGQSQSKRVRTEEEKREDPMVGHSLRLEQQQREAKGVHSCLPGCCSCQPKLQHNRQKPHSTGSPSISSSQTPSPPSSSDSSSSSSPPSSTAHSPDCPGPDSTSTRQRRFLNTAEILNQSGLLAITLRTKELLKQNAATEREILQLRQHTQLLCHIAQASQSSSSDDPAKLNKLFQDMKASGSYPTLDPDRVKMHSSSQHQSRIRDEEDVHMTVTTTNGSPSRVVSLYHTYDGVSPPSPLFAPSPDIQEVPCEPESSSNTVSSFVPGPEQELGLPLEKAVSRFSDNSGLNCLL
uniref:Si:ch211-132b12.7 n=1 Tax=Oryzias latipes TaxID=8090 RepID=A0A3P9I429_ORYLA